ncbi:G-type lectin S-receptor-like serine/threonine-protein kinase At4g27290 [Hevea brasiliensis]|uniref:G-type lectin S-receptor-like serine/threonine-protein kinase At4g27290 n=1 Tax=Hevea brasiliensis TaxID=3981 RepID=UPI0025F99111|nr:G-type lectin S-receptor-like serine/threonine-protein kinase At4g27290 [Hevea brasiliensis]
MDTDSPAAHSSDTPIATYKKKKAMQAKLEQIETNQALILSIISPQQPLKAPPPPPDGKSKGTHALAEAILQLTSKGKNFALGFFSPGNSRYRYLGIWYYKVREQTVVWVANRNHPINGSSGFLSINQYGNLILHKKHKQKVPMWSTNVSEEVTGTCVVQLLDSGNLVLIEERSKQVVWQSFDYPTDTHLPGMKVGLNRKTGFRSFLTSGRSADDPGIGDYSIELNPNGSPQAILYRGTKPYWRSSPWPAKQFVDIRNVSFINNQDEAYVTMDVFDASVIVRVKLDYSGLLMHLTWHEIEGKWKKFWSVPDYRCESYGYCGAFGKCDPVVHVRRFECDCLPGYEPKIPWDWNILMDGSSGCVRKRQESSPVCRHGGGFVKVASVKIPDTSEAVWLGLNMSPMDCELECTRNCSCSAYASIGIPEKGTGCLAWYGELMDTTINIEDGNNIYVRVDALELAEIAKQSNHSLGTKYKLAVFVASVVSSWFIIILFSYLWFKKKGKRVRNKWNERLLDTINDAYPNDTLVGNEGRMSHPDIAFFNLSTMITATNNFSPAKKVGQGGFGLVHEDSRLSIIHRDLKTSNILLDAKMNPKFSDFGLARVFNGDQIQEETDKIVGTFGYMSPKYVMFGKFSTKSDVFSFGVILLKIITGKKNNMYCQEDCYLSMIGYIWHLWRENRPLEIVDSSLRESCPPHEVLRCIQIGLLCVQEDALDRPTMSTVVLMLNSETTLPPPGQPAFTLKKSYNSSSSSAKRDGFCSVDEETITEVVCR